MPKTKLQFYVDASGNSPGKTWLESLPFKAKRKGDAALRILADKAYELRRPYVDYLREGIYEIRWEHKHVNYRMLYFFHGRNLIILSHGFSKKVRIPEKEIILALKRKHEIEEKT